MSIAIYLSPKSAGVSATIYIKVNKHNSNGWLETPNGKVTKVTKLTCKK